MIKRQILILLAIISASNSFSQIYGVGNGGPFAVNCVVYGAPEVVPLTLLSFDAVCTGKQTKLFWSAASAFNSEFFVLERSEDGIHFQISGSVRVKDNDAHTHHYSFTDSNAYTGKSYYRIKQTGTNSLTEYSRVLSVNCGENSFTGIKLYPNPTDGLVNISIIKPGVLFQQASVVVRNAFGQSVYTAQIKSANSIISLGWLPQGIYSVEVRTDGQTAFHMIVLNKK